MKYVHTALMPRHRHTATVTPLLLFAAGTKFDLARKIISYANELPREDELTPFFTLDDATSHIEHLHESEFTFEVHEA